MNSKLNQADKLTDILFTALVGMSDQNKQALVVYCSMLQSGIKAGQFNLIKEIHVDDKGSSDAGVITAILNDVYERQIKSNTDDEMKVFWNDYEKNIRDTLGNNVSVLGAFLASTNTGVVILASIDLLLNQAKQNNANQKFFKALENKNYFTLNFEKEHKEILNQLIFKFVNKVVNYILSDQEKYFLSHNRDHEFFRLTNDSVLFDHLKKLKEEFNTKRSNGLTEIEDILIFMSEYMTVRDYSHARLFSFLDYAGLKASDDPRMSHGAFIFWLMESRFILVMGLMQSMLNEELSLEVTIAWLKDIFHTQQDDDLFEAYLLLSSEMPEVSLKTPVFKEYMDFIFGITTVRLLGNGFSQDIDPPSFAFIEYFKELKDEIGNEVGKALLGVIQAGFLPPAKA